MTRRILLIRHGHSTKADHGAWVSATGLSAWEDAYDAAGIRDDSHPSDELRTVAATAILASSDLPRAIASLDRLAPKRPYATSPLLREMRIQPQPWIPVPLPVLAWDVLSYAQWRWRLRWGTDHADMRRGHEAAAWVESLASEEATVVAMTHGGFRILLGVALAARGWSPAVERRTYDNWSVWTFTLV